MEIWQAACSQCERHRGSMGSFAGGPTNLGEDVPSCLPVGITLASLLDSRGGSRPSLADQMWLDGWERGGRVWV